MTQPRRWVESDAPELVKRLLASAANDRPTATSKAAVAAKLGSVLATPMPATTVAATSALVKAGLSSVALLVVATAGYVATRPSAPPLNEPAQAQVEAPPPAPAPAVDPVTPPEVQPAPRPKRQAAPLVRAAAPAPATEAPDEMALVTRAMTQAQAGEHAAALATLDAHLAAFGDGLLAQEREVLAIQALVALQRSDEAKARAERFKARWPTSSHRLRLEGLLDGR
jgi:hypothetical protein